MARTTRVQRLSRDECGSILLSGLMLVWVTTFVGIAALALSVGENWMALGDARQAKAFYIAEAGLSAALRELTDGDGTNDFAAVFNVSSPTMLFANKPFGGGSYTVTAQPVTQSNPSRVAVTSIACLPAASPCPPNHAEMILQGHIEYRLALGGPFFALGKFSIGGAGSLVDSFDSSQGSYAATVCRKTTPPFDCGADVYTNGTGASSTTVTVSVGNGTPIYGNITASQGQVNLATGAAVYGDVTYDPVKGSFSGAPQQVLGALIQAATIPTTPPPVQACGPPYSSVAYVQSRITPIDAYKYNAATGAFSQNGGQTTIAPGTFCFSSVTITGNATVRIIDHTAPVIFYVTREVDFSSGGVTNTTLKAQQFQILSSATLGTDGIKIAGGPNTYMYVYAPQTQIRVTGGADLYGALLGKDLQATGGARLHFDRALGNSGNLQGGVPTYAWRSWRMCQDPQCT